MCSNCACRAVVHRCDADAYEHVFDETLARGRVTPYGRTQFRSNVSSTAVAGSSHQNCRRASLEPGSWTTETSRPGGRGRPSGEEARDEHHHDDTFGTRSTHAADRATAARQAPAPHAARATQRATLTRRGRWVVTLLILGALLGLSLTLGSVSVATGDRGAAPATEKVVVDQGDTLWGIATRVGGPGETRTVMYEIEKLNHLESSALVEGQVLLVPAS